MGKRKQVATQESVEHVESSEPTEQVEEVEQGEQTDFTGPSSIDVPLSAMKAALLCASDEETRYNLNGFFLHLATDGSVRIVSTDGHRMFLHSQPVEGVAPDWLTAGVIVPKTLMKEQIHLIDKLGSSTARVSYVTGAARIEIADPLGSFAFRNVPVDGTFPDYEKIINDLNVFEGREVSDMSSVAYNATYLKGVGDIAKALGSESVRLFANDQGDPSFITFPQVPGAALVLMPMKHDKALPQETAKLLSGPINGTIAALRAHKTRWAQKANDAPNDFVREEALAKVKEYESRVEAIIKNTSAPALPAPVTQSQPDLEPDTVSADPQPDDQPLPPATEVLAASRSKLPLSLRKKTLRRFKADLNSVLSANYAGLTIGQLGEDVPLEDWFSAGLTAEQAAERAAEWQPRVAPAEIVDEDPVQPTVNDDQELAEAAE